MLHPLLCDHRITFLIPPNSLIYVCIGINSCNILTSESCTWLMDISVPCYIPISHYQALLWFKMNPIHSQYFIPVAKHFGCCSSPSRGCPSRPYFLVIFFFHSHHIHDIIRCVSFSLSIKSWFLSVWISSGGIHGALSHLLYFCTFMLLIRVKADISSVSVFLIFVAASSTPSGKKSWQRNTMKLVFCIIFYPLSA